MSKQKIINSFKHHTMMQTAQNQHQAYPFLPQQAARGNNSRS